MSISNREELQKLADRLRKLHWSLENKGDQGLDWSTARHLEDSIGSGQYLPDDIEKAEELLKKHGF